MSSCAIQRAIHCAIHPTCQAQLEAMQMERVEIGDAAARLKSARRQLEEQHNAQLSGLQAQVKVTDPPPRP